MTSIYKMFKFNEPFAAIVAEMLGFKYIGNHRQPNILVKKKLIKAAGFVNSWDK